MAAGHNSRHCLATPYTMQPPLIFRWRPASSAVPQSVALILAIFAVAAMGIAFWLLPNTGAAVSSIDWPWMWQKAAQAPGKLVPLMLYSAAAVVAIGMRHMYKNRARLILDEHALRHRSGMPVLNRWLDWSLDLDAVRSQALSLSPVIHPRGGHALRFYAVTWGTARSRGALGPQLRPASWYLPEQAQARPALFVDFVWWPSERSRAALQQRFLALPLVQALSQRDIVLPPVTAKPPPIGLDLMVYARMRVAVYLFFGLLFLAVVLLLSMRNTYYFAAPPLTAWLVCAGAADLCMLAWMWGENASAGVARQGDAVAAQPMGFRATQVLLATLVGVAAGLCAPSLPLALSSLTHASEEQAFVLHRLPLELVPRGAGDMPSIQALKASEYWQSLPDGETVTLPVRRGALGLWWQFDASAVREKWIAYYDAHPL